jgi:DNA polymerase IV
MVTPQPAPLTPEKNVTADFSELPPIYILPTHLSAERLRDAEEKLLQLHARLTDDVAEARLILGVVRTKRRLELELRARQLHTTEVASHVKSSASRHCDPRPARKRPRTTDNPVRSSPIIGDDSSTDSAADDGSSTESDAEETHIDPRPEESSEPNQDVPEVPMSAAGPAVVEETCRNWVRLIDLDWLYESAKAGRILSLTDYTLYLGKVINDPRKSMPDGRPDVRLESQPNVPDSTLGQPLPENPAQAARNILERAKADIVHPSQQHLIPPLASDSSGPANRGLPRGRSLRHHNTSQEDDSSSDIPAAPDWVCRRLKYACQRSTPRNSPNTLFIDELMKIKLSRILTLDEVGVRAYSTSIAALAAYPYPITCTKEIVSLPGCDNKIASLWMQWKDSGYLQAVRDFEGDSELQVVRQFYDIWGVGATTAREFYDRGWRDLDDVVEYGWDRLTRVQQIGVKFYEEFQSRVPRSEVEHIADTVYKHAVRVRDTGIECVLVGSYRRGSEDSGDVDIILSHRTMDATNHLITDIVTSLESENWITHTLTLDLSNSQRGQSTLPFRSHGPASHGFDSLDKALVVWQDPSWPSQEEHLRLDPSARNPSPHRRVDIIISPWRTVGCAVLGWSGDTTFERDLRRYAKVTHNWKFDSSGIRDRTTGQVVPIEGPNGVEGTPEDAERKVFEVLGLDYRHPTERWTR